MLLGKIISSFPDQVDLGFSQVIPDLFFNIKEIDQIIVCGMGGSALAAEFLKKFYPIYIHRSYGLPEQFMDKKNLVICLSYSGNTEETLSAYRAAANKKLPIIVISSGGTLSEEAAHNNVPIIEILSKKMEPRMSVVEQVCILINLFSSFKINSISRNDFSVKKKNIDPDRLSPIANKIANTLVDKIPLIYASVDNVASAVYWKAVFNENAKVPAFWNVFPEINHNELMQGAGISWPEKLHILNLIDEDDHPRIQKRMEFTSSIFKKKGMGVDIIKLEGYSPLEKIINSITLGNLMSISLAEKLKIDPIDPDVREEFKEKMQSEK